MELKVSALLAQPTPPHKSHYILKKGTSTNGQLNISYWRLRMRRDVTLIENQSRPWNMRVNFCPKSNKHAAPNWMSSFLKRSGTPTTRWGNWNDLQRHTMLWLREQPKRDC